MWPGTEIVLLEYSSVPANLWWAWGQGWDPVVIPAAGEANNLPLSQQLPKSSISGTYSTVSLTFKLCFAPTTLLTLSYVKILWINFHSSIDHLTVQSYSLLEFLLWTQKGTFLPHSWLAAFSLPCSLSKSTASTIPCWYLFHLDCEKKLPFSLSFLTSFPPPPPAILLPTVKSHRASPACVTEPPTCHMPALKVYLFVLLCLSPASNHLQSSLNKMKSHLPFIAVTLFVAWWRQWKVTSPVQRHKEQPRTQLSRAGTAT